MRGYRSIKTSPKVRSGRQYRAESAVPQKGDFNAVRDEPKVFRKNPGPYHRHVLHVRHVREFVAILPQWAELSEGLNTILLARHVHGCDGFHRAGLVAICAQPRSLCWVVEDQGYVDEHATLLRRLNVSMQSTPEGTELRFAEGSLRAFQLLHVLLHELGHHHDRMTTRSRRRASRGESFAERYANEHAGMIWDRYHELAESW